MDKLMDARTNHQVSPLGITTKNATFSWKMASDRFGATQKSYHLILSCGEKVVWDSGQVDSSLSYGVTCPVILSERTLYQWQVHVVDEKGTQLHSEIAIFETGVEKDSKWQAADFICLKEASEIAPVFLFEKKIPPSITRARLYLTSLGVYQLAINGQLYQDKESMPYLNPGYGNKDVSLSYQTYDILPYLTNADYLHLAIATGNGWYHGMDNTSGKPAIKAMLVLTNEDGEEISITNTSDWQASQMGCLRKNGIYYGEDYDANFVALTDFYKQVSLSTSPLSIGVYPGKIVSRLGLEGKILFNEQLTAQSGTLYHKGSEKERPFVKRFEVKEAGVSLFTQPIQLAPNETLLLDFGQNVTAIPSMSVKARKHTKFTLKFSEILNDGSAFDDTFHSTKGDGEKGTPYFKNLRHARAQVRFVTSGKEIEHYQTATSFFGYRYLTIEVTQPAKVTDLCSLPVSSVSHQVGELTTNNESVNQLMQNVRYSQLSNYFTTATDCPQRDERLFWSGDTQVFSQSALYNYESVHFLKELQTIMAENTLIKGYTPMVVDCVNNEYFSTFCAGWSDALIINAWTLYLHTGEKTILEENYAAFLTYFNFLEEHERMPHAAPIFGDRNCGDWLSYQGTNVAMMGDYYYAYSVLLLSKIATVLGKTKTAQTFQEKFNAIKSVFLSNHLIPSNEFTLRSGNTDYEENQFFGQGPGKKGGVWEDNSQTALLWFLKLGFYEDDTMKKEGLKLLIENVENRHPIKGSIRTTQQQKSLAVGFLGVSVLLPVLTTHGANETAYDLLLQDTIPSWLFEVKAGATTTWERWNSYDPENGFGDSEMNSYNHYAYGAIVEWLYAYVLDIQVDRNQPGFQQVILQPTLDTGKKYNEQDRIHDVCGSYETPYGKMTVAWKSKEDNLSDYHVQLPANTKATLYLPVEKEQDLEISPKRIPSKKVIHNGKEKLKFSLVSGNWTFKRRR